MWTLVSRLNAASGDLVAAKRARNAAVLSEAKQALIGYVAAQAGKGGNYPEPDPGALPCPETPAGYSSTTGTDGKSQGTCGLMVGRFPWRTIGTAKLVDADGEPLWYVVASGWTKPSSGAPVINSNCTSSATLPCSTGRLTVDAVPRAAAALIIAPGAAFNAAAAAGCSARNQLRPTTGTPDLRNYLECENASSPADAVFVTSGPAGSFNDQVMKVSGEELLLAIEAAIARRIEIDIAPGVRSAYSGGAWPAAPALPFAVPFADPTTSPFKGAAGTFQGLLPLVFAETAPGSGLPCASGNRCDPLFVAWTGGSLSGTNLYATSCSVGTTTFTTLQCTYYFRARLDQSDLPRYENFTLSATARNAGMALRQLNPSTALANVNTTGRTATGVLNGDGSATITLGASARASASGSWDANASCGLAPADPLYGCQHALLQVPIWLLQDHPLLDPNDATYGWFLRNRWHEAAYYAVAPGIAPSGARSCTTSVSCLRVAFHPSDGKQRGLIVLAGYSLAGAARPNGTLADWLEGANALAGSRFTLREPALQTNRAFNDRIAVLDSN